MGAGQEPLVYLVISCVTAGIQSSLVPLESPISCRALVSLQQWQQHVKNHRLKEYGDCDLLIHAHQGNQAEVLMDYRSPLRDAVSVNNLSAELWRENDQFKVKMVELIK